MYALKDSDNEKIKGLFYEKELQSAKSQSTRFSRINRILKKKYIRGKLWYLINWEDEDPNLKRWVPAQYVE